MLGVQFEQLQSIVCLGAHADDIEIGCGATILKWLERYPRLQVTWVVWSAAGVRRDEALQSAQAFLASATSPRIVIEDFPDTLFPSQWALIKQRMAQLAREVSADVVLTHRLEDRHQDHRVISELTWNAFRNQLVLEYEIPKFEGDLGQPNYYVAVTPDQVERKLSLLQSQFPTQAGKDWFDEDTFRGLLRIRGLECRSPSRMAEAFHARKILMG